MKYSGWVLGGERPTRLIWDYEHKCYRRYFIRENRAGPAHWQDWEIPELIEVAGVVSRGIESKIKKLRKYCEVS